MSKAFKKKKEEESISNASNKLDFLLGSQLFTKNTSNDEVKLERSLILKCAMFWDTKSRVERIKSLVLSNINLE
jgi:hypothetical protein